MLDTNVIGKYGMIQSPIECAITGKLLGQNFVTMSIGNGYYVRFRSSAHHLLTDEIIEKYKTLVTLPKSKLNRKETE